MTAEHRIGASSQLDQRSGALKDSKTAESDPFLKKRQDFRNRVSTIRLAGQKGLVMDALLGHVDKEEAVTVDQLTADVFPDRIFWDARSQINTLLAGLRKDIAKIDLKIAYEKRGEGRNKRKHYFLKDVLEEETLQGTGVHAEAQPETELLEGLLSTLSKFRKTEVGEEMSPKLQGDWDFIIGDDDKTGTDAKADDAADDSEDSTVTADENSKKPVKKTYKGKSARSDSAQYFPGTGIRLGGNIGINEDGRPAWIGEKPDPKTLPPNPVTYVKNYELTPNASSSHKGLPKITDFIYKNGEKHPHRIWYEEADGPTSQGICVHCGAHKEGKNWLSETDFLTNEDHRSGAV